MRGWHVSMLLAILHLRNLCPGPGPTRRCKIENLCPIPCHVGWNSDSKRAHSIDRSLDRTTNRTPVWYWALTSLPLRHKFKSIFFPIFRSMSFERECIYIQWWYGDKMCTRSSLIVELNVYDVTAIPSLNFVIIVR